MSEGGATSLKDRIEKFEDEKFGDDKLKELEFARRRKLRKERKDILKADRRLRFFKISYLCSCILFAIGIVFTICSTVPSIGEGSFMWVHKSIFKVVGPCCLGVAIVSWLVTSTLVYNRKIKVEEIKGISRQNSSNRASFKSKSNISLTASTIDELGESGRFKGGKRRLRSRNSCSQSSADEDSNFSNSISVPSGKSMSKILLSPMEEVSASNEDIATKGAKRGSRKTFKEVVQSLPKNSNQTASTVSKSGRRTTFKEIVQSLPKNPKQNISTTPRSTRSNIR